MIIGKAKLHKCVVDGQCFQEASEHVSFKIAKIEVQIEYPVTILLALLSLKHTADDIHRLYCYLAINRSKRAEMWLDLEISAESIKHLLILQIHLHVEDLAVDSDSVEQGLQAHFLEEKSVSAETM